MTRATAQTLPGRLSVPILLAYAAPAAALALPTIPVYIHLPALYGDELGLGLATVGVILLIARAFDTVTDPLIGYLSDRFGFRGSYRKPWIVAGAFVAGPAVHQLLVPGPDVTTAHLLIWSIVLYAGWTMIAVPYNAWGAELSGDYHERARITSYRESFALAGILGAGALGLVAGNSEVDGQQATAGLIAIATIILAAVLLPVSLWLVHDRDLNRQTRKFRRQAPFLNEVRSLVDNRVFWRLMLGWFVNGVANGIPAALFIFYLEYGLGAGPTETPRFILAYFLAAVLAIPFWSVLSLRFGKHRAWCIAMFASCLAFAAVPFLPTGAFTLFLCVCIVTGMGLGADLALPPAIQADVADYDTLKNGRQRTGVQFALWGMATKLAMAFAVGTALPLVDWLGFDPATPTERGRMALTVIYALVPVVIKIVAIALIWRFPLTHRRQGIINRRLEALAARS